MCSRWHRRPLRRPHPKPPNNDGPDAARPELVAVVLGLERARRLDAEVLRLLVSQSGESHSERVKVCERNLLVEVLWQHVDTHWVFVGVVEQFDLSYHLVAERTAHHE